jgi:IS5 family transposase
MSFSEPFVTHRTRKDKFYNEVNELIDWKLVDKKIKRYYKANRGEVGRDGYSGLLLFKMLLLGIWNGLSDYGTEDLVNDSLSASKFCDLSLEDDVPDHSVLSRFRTYMTRRGAFDKLLAGINRQLEQQGLMVKATVKVDASLTPTARAPRGHKTYEVKEDNAVEYHPPRVDREAAWAVKAGKLYYGFKKHILTDDNGLVVEVKTSKASTHDSKLFEALVTDSNLPAGTEVQADKAYQSKKHDAFLSAHCLVNGIQRKATRARKLSLEDRAHNKRIAQTRYMVERTFGSIKRWFRAGESRYVGLAKTHSQHVLESIAYNLKRLPNLHKQRQCFT